MYGTVGRIGTNTRYDPFDRPEKQFWFGYLLFFAAATLTAQVWAASRSPRGGFVNAWGDSQVAWLRRLLPEAAVAAPPGLLVQIGVSLIYLILFDAVLYAGHYAFHRVPWLWATHKIHHSAEVLTPITNLRGDLYFHFLLVACGKVFADAGFYLLFRAPASAYVSWGLPAILFWIWMLRDHFSHSQAWISYGKLNFVLICPAHHQIHHSYLEHHRGKNLGFFFPWMDMLFGTFYNVTRRREPMKLGLDGVEEKYINSLSTWGILAYPVTSLFRARRG